MEAIHRGRLTVLYLFVDNALADLSREVLICGPPCAGSASGTIAPRKCSS